MTWAGRGGRRITLANLTCRRIACNRCAWFWSKNHNIIPMYIIRRPKTIDTAFRLSKRGKNGIVVEMQPAAPVRAKSACSRFTAANAKTVTIIKTAMMIIIIMITTKSAIDIIILFVGRRMVAVYSSRRARACDVCVAPTCMQCARKSVFAQFTPRSQGVCISKDDAKNGVSAKIHP